MKAMPDNLYETPDPQIDVDGVKIDLRVKGSGRPLLFLQGIESWIRDETFSDELAKQFKVYLPQNPGFGHSELPDDFYNIGDFANFYLTMLDELDLRDVVVVGTSFGGWIAAELASRSCERLGAVVLANPFGIRISDDPLRRDIKDIYAMSQAEVADHFYHDPEANRRDVTQLPDHTLVAIARSRETMCLFGWEPYMHNPSLKRWLKRINVPTLVLWGEGDKLMSTDYGRAYAGLIPNSTFRTIEEAGHYPHVERPADFVRHIIAFADEPAAQMRISA
jgi:pimeloyl-ACP methyl ester carboxylesterase